MANEQRVRPRKRRKVCAFCVDKVTSIDYKDTAKLRRYLSERGKILPVRSLCCPTWLTKYKIPGSRNASGDFLCPFAGNGPYFGKIPRRGTVGAGIPRPPADET